MLFYYGFEVNYKKYGWYKKELYRLPFFNGKSYYKIKKINPMLVKGLTVYNCDRKIFTINRLKELTINIEWTDKLSVIKSFYS